VTSGIIRATTTPLTHSIIRTTAHMTNSIVRATTGMTHWIIRTTAHMTNSIIGATTSKADQRRCGRCSASDACTGQQACQRNSCNLCSYLHYCFLSFGSGRGGRLLWILDDRFDSEHARRATEGLAEKI
jgi:hypothetical protein